jgi:hypothetical protein
MNTETIETEEARRAGEHSTRLAKWAAVVDDTLVPMPQRRIPVSVIRAQSSIPEGRTLVRDHNSPDDVVLRDDIVDLADGNVFYTLSNCDVQPRPSCASPAKLAFIVNDRAEVTVRGDQTGQMLKELFSLPHNATLVRDYQGPDDSPIELSEQVRFADGPVFYTRQIKAELEITVNCRLFTDRDGVKRHMSGREIATLVYPDAPNETRIFSVSPEKREIGLDERVEIRNCEVFDVVRKKVDGGYEDPRVERELTAVREGGQRISLVSDSVLAVIYHDLRTRPGLPVTVTDVLVPVPGGYPGQMIDWAYLPTDSPLIGRVKGSPQNHRISAMNRLWQQISYHPHNGGGAPPWNPTLHGFHTYAGELLSWLYNAN